MFSALRRLFKVSFIFLIAFSFGLFWLRNLGLREKVIAKKLPFFEKSPLIILKGGRSDVAPSHSREALEKALQSPSTLISVDVSYDLDSKKWVLSSNRQEGQEGLYKVGFQFHSPLNFREFLDLMPLERPFLLHLHNFKTRELDKLLSQVKNKRPIIIESSFSKALKYLRGIRPHWFYVSHSSSWVQLLFMTPLFIEPFHQFKSDFFILSKEDHFPLRLIREIKRRRRKIILKVSSIKDYEKFLYKDSLSGIFIEDAKDFLASCSSLPSLSIQNLISFCS